MNNNLAQTRKISLCGIIAALSTVIMLIAYFPYLTYALPAIAGSLLIIIVIEIGIKYAVLIYLTVSVVSFIICEKEASVTYILFFGYYPILKLVIDKLKYKGIKWLLKIITFNIMFALLYLVSTEILGIDTDEMGDFGKYSEIILFFAGNIMYVLYDIALGRVILHYLYNFRERIKKYIG